MKKVLKTIGIVLLVLVVLAGAGIGYLTAAEYKPADEENLTVMQKDSDGDDAVSESGIAEEVVLDTEDLLTTGQTIRVLTWNMGYGALGNNADFFMDGGKGVLTADKARVQQNMEDILSTVQSLDPDILLCQEIDTDSKRSRHFNEVEYLQQGLDMNYSTYALNYKCAFVPYPIPPMGKITSGIGTFSRYQITDAVRVALKGTTTWPTSVAYLKRCLAVNRIPVEGSDKELVIINLHLEAYDSGDAKEIQTRMLAEILQEETDAGNYVIAGGDFNQLFSDVDTSDLYPIISEDYWQPGIIDVDALPDSCTAYMDSSSPSCRSLDRPLEGADTDPSVFQYYLIDGFIVSDNIQVQGVETQDLGFQASDHNPVLMEAVLCD